MKRYLPTAILACCFTASAAGAQNSAPSPTPRASRQRFVCNTGYSVAKCDEQMNRLRLVLDKYPAADLGEWTWVLVRSQDWKDLLASRGLDSDAPAISVLDKRISLFDEALLADVPGRVPELMRHWRSTMRDLLELAVTHELGHSLCNEAREWKAEGYGKALRNHQEFTCKSYTYVLHVPTPGTPVNLQGK